MCNVHKYDGNFRYQRLAKIRFATLFFQIQTCEWYLSGQLRTMKVGILGGGQLGRMLLQTAANYPIETFVLENDRECPAAHLCHQFIKGDIKNFEDVYNFGKLVDVLTIEIESVNTDALEKLEAEGVTVIPSSSAIKIINNKIHQKQFYAEHAIPSPAFVITQNQEQLKNHLDYLPAVHKLATGGYDGRGVQLLHKETDLQKGFNSPAVLEKMVDIKKEIAIMVAINQKGETAIYAPVEMHFDPILNLLDFQVSPADLPKNQLWKAEAMALKVVKELKSPGIFAIEMFIDRTGDVWVNETAPRVHNSGHHTIEANYCSQFDMLWRILLNFPLGNTGAIVPSSLVNIVGAEGFQGKAVFKGLEDVLKLENVFVHLYGKKETKPGRKMGHVTILSTEKQELVHTAKKISQLLNVESAST